MANYMNNVATAFVKTELRLKDSVSQRNSSREMPTQPHRQLIGITAPLSSQQRAGLIARLVSFYGYKMCGFWIERPMQETKGGISQVFERTRASQMYSSSPQATRQAFVTVAARR